MLGQEPSPTSETVPINSICANVPYALRLQLFQKLRDYYIDGIRKFI